MNCVGAEYDDETSARRRPKVQAIDMDELVQMLRKCSLHDEPEQPANGAPAKENARLLSPRKQGRKVRFSPLNQRHDALNAEQSTNVNPEVQHKNVKVRVPMESKTSPELSLKGAINLFQHGDKRGEEENSHDRTEAKYTKICKKETCNNNTNNINTGIAGKLCKSVTLIQ